MPFHTGLVHGASLVLVIVDVQERLAAAMTPRDDVLSAIIRLVRVAALIGAPIVVTRQYPEGLGPTEPSVAELISGDPITKLSFSCCGEPKFMDALNRIGRKQVVLAGIETHVCVYQTAANLIAGGFEVQVVADAVGSRTSMNRETGLNRMAGAGASITSIETVLFELLGVAKGEKFKEILKIVK